MIQHIFQYILHSLVIQAVLILGSGEARAQVIEVPEIAGPFVHIFDPNDTRSDSAGIWYTNDHCFTKAADGTFQDRRLMPKTAHSVALTASGTIVMQGEEGVNGFHAITYGFSRRGVQLWEKWIDNRPDGSCCASSWTVKTIALRQGGSLTVANRVDRSNNSVNLYYVGVLQELDEKGTYQ